MTELDRAFDATTDLGYRIHLEQVGWVLPRGMEAHIAKDGCEPIYRLSLPIDKV